MIESETVVPVYISGLEFIYGKANGNVENLKKKKEFNNPNGAIM